MLVFLHKKIDFDLIFFFHDKLQMAICGTIFVKCSRIKAQRVNSFALDDPNSMLNSILTFSLCSLS